MNDEDGKEDLYRNGKDMTDIYIKKNKEGAIVLISDIDYKTVSVCSYYVIWGCQSTKKATMFLGGFSWGRIR